MELKNQAHEGHAQTKLDKAPMHRAHNMTTQKKLEKGRPQTEQMTMTPKKRLHLLLTLPTFGILLWKSKTKNRNRNAW